MTIRRIKSYTGQTGFVWQYYFVGKRPAIAAEHVNSTEFVFDVTGDRRTIFAVSIFVAQEAVEQWAASHGRPLTETEQYAAAKMRLFQSFDEVPDMMQSGRELLVTKDNLEELLQQLGLE